MPLELAARPPPALPALASWTPTAVAASLALFLLAALTEVGGGWLVWQGVVPPRRRWPALWIVGGCVLLIAYGFVPTLQPRAVPPGAAPFNRTYAVYGGIFIVASYAVGWILDGARPDVGDWVGAGIALAGVLVAWFWPRKP